MKIKRIDQEPIGKVDSDPDFDRDMLGLVADAVCLIVLIWEIQDDIFYLSEQWSLLTQGQAQPHYGTAAAFRDQVHPDDQGALDHALIGCIKGSTDFYVAQFRVRHVASGWTWMEARGRVVEHNDAGRASRLMATIVDISERKHAALALEETEERYSSLVNHGMDGLLLTLPDGRILSANPAACRLAGHTESELKMLGCGGLLDPSDERIGALFRQQAYAGSARGRGRIIRKDGTPVEIELSAAMFTDSAGLRKTSMILREAAADTPSARSLVLLAELYAARSQSSQAVFASRNGPALCQEICRIANFSSLVTLAWIGLPDSATGLLSPAARHGQESDFPETFLNAAGPRPARGRDAFANALRERRIQVCNDLLGDQDNLSWRRMAKQHGFKSMALFPFAQVGESPGILALYSSEKDFFDPRLIAPLSDMAADIGIGLKRLHRDAALQNSELRFRTLWETTTDAILMLDQDSVIHYANAAVLDTFGYRAQELLGRKLELLQPEHLREAHQAGMRRYIETGTRRLNWRSTTSIGLHKKGHCFPVELAFSDFQAGSSRHFVACIRDITERTRTEELVSHQNRILKMIANGTGLESTLDAINELIESQLPGAVCTIQILDDSATRFISGIGASLPQAYHDVVSTVRIGPHSGSCGTAVFRREPVIVADIGSDPLWEDYRGLALEHGLKACFSWPLAGRFGQVLGTFAIYRRDVGLPGDEVIRLVEFARDLAALAIDSRKSEQRILYLAHYDELTGLPNRAMFSQALSSALVKADRNRHKVGLLFLDLDHFKNINDTRGHDAGDQVLREIGSRLREAVREVDVVARLGGDEFVVLVEDFREPQSLVTVASKLIAQVGLPMTIQGREYLQTVSVGISTYPQDGTDMQSLIKYADIAMYRAKESGRNSHCFYSVRMSAGSLERTTLESGMRLALERGEFFLHFQPKMAIASGQVTGVEALLRWRHPERGVVAPASFVPLAEETGQIVAIGQWVLRAACVAMRGWLDAGLVPGHGVRVAVNLSARQITQDGLLEDIAAALAGSGLGPEMLELDITEGVVTNNASEVIRVLDAIRATGVLISIDDFGTGYGSLANLRRLPIDSVKIDGSFIRAMTRDPGDAALIRAVIAMAHALHLRVVAEGVESDDQLAFLREHGCDEVQGFLFSPPLPDDELNACLRELGAPSIA